MGGDRERLALVLAAAAVLTQVAYPLSHDEVRHALTIAIVLLFAGASAAHVIAAHGRRGLAAVAITTVGGFAVEVLGVHTGSPFGHYTYAGSLGPRLWGVPLLIGAAWTMLAWPAAAVAQRLARGYPARVVVGAWALAAWDLFLDPQMVGDGHWHWDDPDPHLPGVATVPLTNYAGWLLVALAMSLALQALLWPHNRDDTVPIALYLWTCYGSVFAFLAFLDLPAAAGWGALGMGLVAVPVTLQVLTANVRAHAHRVGAR